MEHIKFRKRILNKQAYQTGCIRFVQRDCSCEFISFFAYVCANGILLLPVLIYQGASGDLQDTCIEDLQEGEQVYFGAAVNGCVTALAWRGSR
jgi:hypothetical protein